MSNLLLIGAIARNTGKTELACRIIKKLHQYKIIAIKVTTINEKSNGCPSGRNCGVCASLNENYTITEEKDSSCNKDTGKLLLAGAYKVFWLKSVKQHLEQGVRELLELVEKDTLLICESNSIRNIIEPGLFIITKSRQEKKIKPSCWEVRQYADFNLTFSDFDQLLKNLDFRSNPDNSLTWYIKDQS